MSGPAMDHGTDQEDGIQGRGNSGEGVVGRGRAEAGARMWALHVDHALETAKGCPEILHDLLGEDVGFGEILEVGHRRVA